MEPYIVKVVALRWLNAEHSLLGADVTFSHRGGVDPMCVTGNYDTQLGRELWDEAMEGLHGKIAPYVAPEPEPEPILILPAVTLWERMTEAEGEQVETVMQTQPFRVRQIFTTAQTYRSDHELWPLLQQITIGLFGTRRATELLAPP